MRIHDLKMRNMANALSLSVFIAFKGTNETIKISSFKSNENTQKKEGGPDRSVSNN